jgi:hypothetical protein
VKDLRLLFGHNSFLSERSEGFAFHAHPAGEIVFLKDSSCFQHKTHFYAARLPDLG